MTSKPASDPKESVEANPHPASSHRAPQQLAADARGPTAPHPAETQPVRDVNPAQRIDAETPSDVERRRAVKESARKSATKAQRNVEARADEGGADERGTEKRGADARQGTKPA